MKLSGWGRYPTREAQVDHVRSVGETAIRVTDGVWIPRGGGRAYGDAAIGVVSTLDLSGMNRMIEFNPETGVLTAEAGVTLAAVIRAMLPRGFFPHVVPGTKYVTLGGMVASNIHGKNHHGEGGFGRNVVSFTLVGPDGVSRLCSREENRGLFDATIGGMGLTGVISTVTLRLRPVETGMIVQRTIVAEDLASAMACFEANNDATYAVAWIDTLARGSRLGRSLVYLGEHARRSDLVPGALDGLNPKPGRVIPVPVDLPSFTLNRASVSLFNAAYQFAGSLPPLTKLVPVDSYFFPLDTVSNWNRIYGAAGFVQYQCVLPPQTSQSALTEILDRVAHKGNPSFLAVLKLMGPEECGLISFPMPGYTLALDFPAGPKTFSLLRSLDPIVQAAGGRLYLSKDAVQPRDLFEAGNPTLGAFRALRREIGAAARFRSLQSERLGL